MQTFDFFLFKILSAIFSKMENKTLDEEINPSRPSGYSLNTIPRVCLSNTCLIFLSFCLAKFFLRFFSARLHVNLSIYPSFFLLTLG